MLRLGFSFGSYTDGRSGERAAPTEPAGHGTRTLMVLQRWWALRTAAGDTLVAAPRRARGTWRSEPLPGSDPGSTRRRKGHGDPSRYPGLTPEVRATARHLSFRATSVL